MAEFIFKDIVKNKGTSHLFEIASAATSTEEIWMVSVILFSLLQEQNLLSMVFHVKARERDKLFRQTMIITTF